ncbi:MAG: hypothetical protein ABIK83_05250 [Candidatus Zixiibacteriota bacterium]
MNTIFSRLALMLLIALVVIVSGCGGDEADEQAASEQPTTEAAAQTPTQQLTTAIDIAIQLVEADDVHGLFEKFTPPDVLDTLIAAGQLQAAEGRFRIFKNEFVAAMKVAKTVDPEFNEDSTIVAYAVEEVPGGKVKFQKIDGNWYFSD